MKCKNCNVRIASYLDRCPLCGEKINNSITDDNPYNSSVESFSKRVNTLYFSRIILQLLVLTAFVTMLINFLVNKHISWSLYVLFSAIYVSSFYSFIVLKDKKWGLLINVLCMEALLFIIAYLTHTISWFYFLVGPIIIIVTIFIYLNLFLAEFKNILRSFSVLILYLAGSLCMINGLIKAYKTGSFVLTWSKYSGIAMLIICLISFLLSFNKKIQNEVEKRFFI